MSYFWVLVFVGCFAVLIYALFKISGDNREYEERVYRDYVKIRKLEKEKAELLGELQRCT